MAEPGDRVRQADTADRLRRRVLLAGRCESRCYEPGINHEHACLASMQHGALDHTCPCGKTWPSLFRAVAP